MFYSILISRGPSVTFLRCLLISTEGPPETHTLQVYRFRSIICDTNVVLVRVVVSSTRTYGHVAIPWYIAIRTRSTMVSSCVFVFAQLSRRLSRRSSSTAVCRQSDCEKMMAFLSKGGTSSKTIQRLQHEAAAKQAMAGIAKQAAAAGRVAVKAASRALLLADEQQNGADRQANAAAAANAAERAARHMPDHRVVVEEESDSGGGAPKKKRRKSGIKQLTWPVRAVAIFMFLHPQLFNGNVKVASTVFGVSRPAFMAWLKPSFIYKWHDMVSELTWAKGRAGIKGFVGKFARQHRGGPAGQPDDACPVMRA